MKNLSIAILLIPIVLSCDSRTYDEISGNQNTAVSVNYTTHIKPIIQNNCVSCHSGSGSASFAPLTTYQQAKNSINSIIERIEKPNGDPQKMPVGGSLSNSEITLIKNWKANGLPEN